MKAGFVFLFMLAIMASCQNLVNGKSADAIDQNIEFEDIHIKQHIHPQDSFFLSSLKQNLGKAFNDSSFFYSLDSLQKPYTDYWKLLQDTNLVMNWNYKFTNRVDTGQYITLGVFLMKQDVGVVNVIDKYCDDERHAELAGRKSEFQNDALAKGLPYRTFRNGNILYILDASKDGLPLLKKGCADFQEHNTIPNEDVVPSEREYISQDMKNKLEPFLKKWLQFHNLNLDMFYGGIDSNQDNVFEYDASADTLSVYYNTYGQEYNVYNPVLYDYSPDRNSFLIVRPSAGVYQEEKDGKYYYYGGDDCQSIWLVQRKQKRVGLVKWNGAIQFTESAFWVDNKTFGLVSYNYYSAVGAQIQIFGKENYTYAYRNGRIDWSASGSYFEHDLKSRGIITD